MQARRYLSWPNVAAAAALIGASIAALSIRQTPRDGPDAQLPVAPVEPSGESLSPELPPPEVADIERELAAPTGEPPAIDCDGARKIVAQARATLAVPAERIDSEKFALAVSDWLDPHGLWSVAPDSPIGHALASSDLSLDLEAPAGSGPCVRAAAVGVELAAWMTEVRAEMRSAREAGVRAGPVRKHRFDLAAATPFEDGAVTRRAHDLSRALGRRLGALEASFGPDLEPYTSAAVDRLAPDLEPSRWANIVLAAAVRAYVPQIDPHGAWAPIDEEASIYDLDLEVDPPPRLWVDMTRTAIGVRIDEGARAPLRDGDVVLRVGNAIVAGMSVEQGNQLSFVPHGRATRVAVLRSDHPAPVEVDVEFHTDLLVPPPQGLAASGLATSRVDYGQGSALVVKIPDVPDDLGERLMAALASEDTYSPLGVLLDLRGNGGGSTEGALTAIGVFLPGAPLFPMRRRDGEISVDRAPRLPADAVWTGPVAALVDGESASAAEMIAGAIGAYGRGPVLGGRTYGKGCAQEYLDDEAGAGVLRLTTLVFSLPDGSPVQRVGVTPHVALGLPAALDREEALPRAPDTWRGPDVRTAELMREIPWPDHGGRLGQAEDPVVYRALRTLGSTRATAHRPGPRALAR